MGRDVARYAPMIISIIIIAAAPEAWPAWQTALAAGAASIATSIVVSDMLKPDDISPMARQERGIRANTRSTTEPLKVVYGTMRVGGNDVYIHMTGDKNKTAWIVQTLAEGECDGIFDDQVFLDGSLYTEFGGLVEYWFHNGSATQTYDTNINAANSEFTANMRHTCYIVWKFTYDSDYFHGLPKRQVTLKGKKLYDFRTSSTAYSENPVLCLYDYITDTQYGFGYSSSNIDTTTWTAAANYCDTNNFTCNLIVADEQAYDTLEAILRLFRGRLTWWNGALYLNYADTTVESSVMTLTDEHIVRSSDGKATISFSQSSVFSKPDGLVVSFISADKDYTADELIVGSDIGNIQRIDLPGCTDREMAGIIGTYILERMRLNREITGTFRGDALKLDPYDIVTLTSSALGISSKELRVKSASFASNMTVTLQLQYEDDDLYNNSYEQNIDTSYSTTFPDPKDKPGSVSNVRIVEETYNFRLHTQTRLKVLFDEPDTFFDHADVWLMNVDPDNPGKDHTSYENDSDWPTGASLDDGIWGKCATLDGSAVLTIVDATPLSSIGSSDFSLSLWVKTSANARLFDKTEDSNNGFYVGANGSGDVTLYENVGGTSHSVTWTAALALADDWEHLVLLVDRTNNEAKLYIDNSLESTKDITSFNSDFSNAGDIGLGGATAGSSYLTGSLDEVQLFDAVLGTDDINSLYSLKPASGTNLVGYWPFGRWEYAFPTPGDFHIDPVEEGVKYYYRIRSVSIWGVREDFDTCYGSSHLVGGLQNAPASLDSIDAVINKNNVNIYSDKLSDPDIEVYEFRLGSAWSAGIFMASLRSPNLSLYGVKPGSHQFWCAPLRNNGLYATSPATAAVTISEPPMGWSLSYSSTCDYDADCFGSTGTHDNTEHTTYDAEDAVICSHGGGTLVGTYTSPVYDIGSSKTLLAFIDADIVVTGVGNDWDTVAPLTLTGSELVTDGGFANWTGDDLDDWSESSCDASEDTGGQSGSCAKVTLSADAGYIYQAISVTAGNTYELSGYYKGTNAQVGIYDVTGSAWIAGEFRAFESATSFAQFNRIFVAPTGCTSVQIRLGGKSNGDIVYYDTISCKQVDSNSASWEDMQVDTRTWTQVFSTSEGARVEMSLKYGDTSPPTNEVAKLEILTAIVAGRYFQTVTTITDPSDGINAYVKKQALKLYEEV